MKKKLYTLCVLCMLFQSLQARTIDKVVSQQMAVEFIGQLDGVSSATVSIDGMATITSTTDVSIPVLYIYNTHSLMGKARFVIVAADNGARQILAYGDSTIEDFNNIYEGLQEMIDIYRQQIESLISGGSGEGSGGSYSYTSNYSTWGDVSDSVLPLLSTKWGQDNPYNIKSPEYEGEYCKTGCSSTALSMIFKYHGHANMRAPISGYKTTRLGIELEELPPVDFDWNNMDTVYKNVENSAQADTAVAQLMRYVGQAEKMDYTPDGSSALIPNVCDAINFFGYTCNRINYDSIYSPQSWEKMILKELQEDRPVMYFASSKNGSGHTFVIDGYDAVMNQYHVNWGWEGEFNCYCALSALRPFENAPAYDTGQSVIINIKPAEKEITVDKDTVTLRTYASRLTRETITVSGLNLSQEITLEIKNDTAQCFEVHPSVIQPIEAIKGKVVNIYFRPSQVGWASATLVLSSDEIVPIEIELKGYGIKHDGDIVLDSTSLNIVDKVILNSSSPMSINVRRLGMIWQGANDQTPIMMNMPEPLIEPNEFDNQERYSLPFSVMIEGDSCYHVNILQHYLDNDPEPPDADNHMFYTLVVSYSFKSPPGPHEAIVRITHNSLSVPPAYLYLHGYGVWDEDAPYLYGDANGDNIVDVSDVTALISYVLGITNGGIIEPAADMNGDGLIDVSDVTMLIKYALAGTPNFSTSITALDFGTVESGDEHSETFTVSGFNLVGNLTLSTSDPFYSVTPTTITPAEATAGATVTVTYNPIVEGAHEATLNISGGGATGKSVSLFGECIAKPTISATPSTWDFGNVDLGYQVSKTFTITGTNLSDDITLGTQMETTGGEYTINPTWLPASGGTVTITYRPLDTGSSGAQFIFTSGRATTSIIVEGNCVITPSISTNHPSMNFGSVAAGDEKSKKLIVTGANLTGNLTLSTQNSYYTVTPSTITAEEAAVGKTVTVTFNPAINAVPGDYNSTITISGGGAENEIVSLVGECVLPTILTSTNSLEFTESGSEQFTVLGSNWPDYLTLTITGSGSQYFSLDKNTISKSEATDGATITVSCNPPSNLINANAQIVISGGGTFTRTVDLNYITNSPTISPSVTSLNYGSVARGRSSSRVFMLEGANLTGDLTLSSSSLYFEVSPTTVTADEAAAGKRVQVTYVPIVEGTDTATITISGGGAVSRTVSLKGTCVLPEIITDLPYLAFNGNGSKQFTIQGINLTGDVILTIMYSNNQYFTLDKTNIEVDDALNGAIVTVTCNVPNYIQSAINKIRIETSGFYKTFYLYYTSDK